VSVRSSCWTSGGRSASTGDVRASRGRGGLSVARIATTFLIDVVEFIRAVPFHPMLRPFCCPIESGLRVIARAVYAP